MNQARIHSLINSVLFVSDKLINDVMVENDKVIKGRTHLHKHFSDLYKLKSEAELLKSDLELEQKESAGTVFWLIEFLIKNQNWSKQTFGTGKRTKGIIKHIKRELEEIQDKPEDYKEWIDIILLAMDGYWRHGGDVVNLPIHLDDKQKINFNRVYPYPISEDEPSQHIKQEEGTKE